MQTTESNDGTAIALDSTGDCPPVILVADSGDTATYAVEREIEDLQAVVGEAGGSARVFGSSSGGNLALPAVRQRSGHPEAGVVGAELPRRREPSAASGGLLRATP